MLRTRVKRSENYDLLPSDLCLALLITLKLCIHIIVARPLKPTSNFFSAAPVLLDLSMPCGS